jgi:uncharacterized protein (DUF924 family)
MVVPAPEPVRPEDVLSFWFGDGTRYRREWFAKDDKLDGEIRARFGDAIENAARGEFDAWKATTRGRLALVILLDQFSRNVFRGTSRAFAQDARARELAVAAIDRGDDRALTALERHFLYMPLTHAEDRAAQALSVGLFEGLALEAPQGLAEALAGAAKYARMHRDIVDRFGRFPHRNAILGRASTAEESEFLSQPGSGF